MIRKLQTLARLAVGIAVAASLVALAAPAAVAGARTNHDAAFVPFVTDFPKERAATSHEGYRFVTDTLAPGGGLVVAAPADSFHWGDAGIGAGVTAVLMISLLGSSRLLIHRRRTLAA
jgi:hypothetical protein